MAEITKVNLYSKLTKMRVELQKKEIKKTGENTFSKFKYYELDDFLPQCNEISANNYTVFLYQLHKEEATLTLINCEDTADQIQFTLPIATLDIKGANAIQNIGGLATYTRRYLYMIAFEISEHDEFDPNERNTPKAENKVGKATDEKKQQEEVANLAAQKINSTKVVIIKNKILALGVPESAICDRYKVEKLEDITEGIFLKVLKALDNSAPKTE